MRYVTGVEDYYIAKYKIRKFDVAFTNNRHNKRNTLPHKLYFIYKYY